MARAFGCPRIQRHAGNRSRLFSLNLFPRTGRDSLRNRNRPARLHIGRRLESTRRKFAASTVAGVVSLANRKRFAADRTSDKPMTPDFIHEFVPGSSNRTLLLLHGTGGNERDLIPLGRELDPNAALLSPRGKVLENGMPRFFRGCGGSLRHRQKEHYRGRLLEWREYRCERVVAAPGDFRRSDSVSRDVATEAAETTGTRERSRLDRRGKLRSHHSDIGNPASSRTSATRRCRCHRPIS